jgi:succinoglycan biosynthesis protein ExoO
MVDVSIIIAAWNAEATVRDAVESALTQEGANIEVIVADDASTEGTASVICGLRDPRVRCVRLPENGGPAAARNAAIDQASGTWFAVLDADDVLLPGRINSLIATATQHGLDVVTDNMWMKDVTGARRLFITESLDGGVEPLALADYVLRNRLFGKQLGDGYLKPIFAARLFRDNTLRYDTTTRVGEDFLIVAEAMTLGARYGRSRSAGYVYATGGASISRRLRLQDAEAMVEADQRIIARYADRLKAGDRAAWSAHLESLRDGASFVAMVDCIKARDLAQVALLIGRRPSALRHFSMPLRARLDRIRPRRGRDVAAS